MESFHINSLAFLHLLLLSFSIFSMLFSINSNVLGQCLQAESSSLLQLKQGFAFAEPKTWIPGTNCCMWEGVTCDEWRRVIALDLSGQIIGGTINPSLFNLTSLRYLNFARNMFDGKSIPDCGWERLANLSIINLCNTGFFGKVPIGITRLTKLTVIDLSSDYYKPENLSFTIKPTFLQNMSKLRELYLDNVDLSTYGNEWGGALANSTMMLEVLSMVGCSLFGVFPKQIFQLRNLTYLDISKNLMLYGSLPDFPVDNSLEFLVLSFTNFSGNLPNTIGNLKFMRDLDLSRCQFSGRLPLSMENLSQLMTLDLSNNNNLQGPIPRSIFQLPKLFDLSLASNNFNEVMELELIKDLKNLMSLDLSNSGFSLSSLESYDGSSQSCYPNISFLALASCNLTMIPTFIKYQHEISFLDLSNNRINGEIPSWIWSIDTVNLSCNMFTHVTMYPMVTLSFSVLIDLHSNMLEGSIPPLQFFDPLSLDLSNNRLTSFISFNTTANLTYLWYLSLANNNLTGEIPSFIYNMTNLQVLDLSNNRLTGSIPSNLLREGTYLQVLNLRGNLLHGAIPNEFSPKCKLRIINFRDNQLEGLLPRSLSNCQSLEIMDLGNNNLKDTFPYWLGNMPSLRVLVLRYNKFHGLVGPPDENYESNYTFSMLHVLDISSNNFKGNLCAKCFSNLKSMMTSKADTDDYVPITIVDINYYIFVLPLYFMDQPVVMYYMGFLTIMSKGQPMTLRKLWTIVKVIDFSNNFFEGEIPIILGQLSSLQVLNMSHNYLTGKIIPQLGKLSQIESLDLSMNSLSGKIPQELVSLYFLEYLNLSYNKLIGNIPVGGQFFSFPNTSFEGNNELCLLPCNTSVPRVNNTTKPSNLGNRVPKNRSYMIILGILFGVGFGVSMAIVVVLDVMCCDRSKRSRRPVDG